MSYWTARSPTHTSKRISHMNQGFLREKTRLVLFTNGGSIHKATITLLSIQWTHVLWVIATGTLQTLVETIGKNTFYFSLNRKSHCQRVDVKPVSQKLLFHRFISGSWWLLMILLFTFSTTVKICSGETRISDFKMFWKSLKYLLKSPMEMTFST